MMDVMRAIYNDGGYFMIIGQWWWRGYIRAQRHESIDNRGVVFQGKGELHAQGLHQFVTPIE